MVTVHLRVEPQKDIYEPITLSSRSDIPPFIPFHLSHQRPSVLPRPALSRPFEPPRRPPSPTMGLLARALRSIVRNDAMRSDPDEIYNWRIVTIVFSACFGGMLFGWETGAIGGVLAMPEMQARFGYADASENTRNNLDQNIVSTLQAGCFLACFITSWCSEKFGRKLCLLATGTLTIIGIIFQASSTARGDIAVMYVGRFISGMGVGAASTLTPLYVSECAPRAIRGGLICRLNPSGVVGARANYSGSVLSTVHRHWSDACLLVRPIRIQTPSLHHLIRIYRVNYGSLLHSTAPAIYVVPLTLQALPPVYVTLPAPSGY